jgi:hypothetical protein
VGGYTIMSFIYSNSAFDSGILSHTHIPGGSARETAESREASDRAIDAALRCVPLPDGFLTRLGKLAYAMPDEAADQVDWLGC